MGKVALYLVLLLAVFAFVANAVVSVEDEIPVPSSTEFDDADSSEIPLAAVEQTAEVDIDADAEADAEADAALAAELDLEAEGSLDAELEGVDENSDEAAQETEAAPAEEEQQGEEAPVEDEQAHSDDESFAGLQTQKGIFKKTKKGAKKVGRGIKKVAKKLGRGLKAVGRGIKKGAKWVGKKVWSGVKKVGKAAGKAALDAVTGRGRNKKTEAKLEKLEKEIAAVKSSDRKANAATDQKVDQALAKLRRLHRTMQELRRLMTQIKTHVVSLLPKNTAERYMSADKSTVSNSQFTKTLVEAENKLKDPWHPDANKGAEYNNDVVPDTTKVIDRDDDHAAQEVMTDQQNVSEESKLMAKKDDVSLVL